MDKKSKELTLKTKFIISAIWDILDFTVFRIPVIGTITDIISVPLTVYLWGPIGYLSAWEIVDVTDQVDGIVPTMTLIGIVSYLKQKK